MQKSILDSCQYSSNTTILCIWGERDAGCLYESGYRKRKKRYLIDVQLSTDKKLATVQDHQTLQNSDEKQYYQYWILLLVVFTRLPAEIAC